jgi:hypothetical protein
MTRFNAKLGAALLCGLGAVYLVIALATGHSAAAEPPPDLSAREAGLDPVRALALLAREGGKAALVDVRPAERRALFAVPGAKLAAPEARAVLEAAAGRQVLLLLGDRDELGAKLAGELRVRHKLPQAHFVAGGDRALYLALELPVPLFNDQAPPRGYLEAVERVRGWVRARFSGEAPAILRALGTLATSSYGPAAIGTRAKPKASGAKKKISGGCG